MILFRFKCFAQYSRGNKVCSSGVKLMVWIQSKTRNLNYNFFFFVHFLSHFFLHSRILLRFFFLSNNINLKVYNFSPYRDGEKLSVQSCIIIIFRLLSFDSDRTSLNLDNPPSTLFASLCVCVYVCGWCWWT